MASHVIGPLIVADRQLTNYERTTLEAAESWSFALLSPVTVYTVGKVDSTLAVHKSGSDPLTVHKSTGTLTVTKGPPDA